MATTGATVVMGRMSAKDPDGPFGRTSRPGVLQGGLFSDSRRPRVDRLHRAIEPEDLHLADDGALAFAIGCDGKAPPPIGDRQVCQMAPRADLLSHAPDAQSCRNM